MDDTRLPAIPDLDALAARINAEHRACEQAAMTTVQHAITAGALLVEAKDALPHGGWLPWLTEHFDGSQRTAQAYMRIARELPQLDGPEAQRVADLPLRDALRELAEPREVEADETAPAILDASVVTFHGVGMPASPSNVLEVLSPSPELDPASTAWQQWIAAVTGMHAYPNPESFIAADERAMRVLSQKLQVLN